MLTAKNLSFGYPTHKVLEDSSFTIPTGSKVALVGPNGAGKTTLLKIVSGQEEPDSGSVEIIGSIGSVPQEVKLDPILEQAISVRAYIDPNYLKRDDELERMLHGMELNTVQLTSAPQQLSGGQKTKLAFLRNVIAEPDILILDEPTNFLDTPGKRWVMNFLAHYPKTLLIVSHDIGLLDQSISKVLAIDTWKKTIEEYTGNYSQHLKLKKQRQKLAERQRAIQERHIKQMTASLSKLKRQKSESGVKRRVQMRKRIEKEKQALPELPPQIKSVRFNLPEPANVGRIALQMTNIHKSYGRKQVLSQVNLMVERGQKIALIGRNGAGKSTLLKIIMGMIEPDNGKVERHSWLDIGYYAQEHENFKRDQSLLQAVEEHMPTWTEGQMRSLLGRFMFSGDRVHQSIGTLSGGEKTRLSIAMLAIKGHNLLVLDEPTTYLDVMSQRAILEVLKDYRGAMIVVSHTEDFIRELEPDKALILPDNKFDFWRPEMLELVADSWVRF